MQCTRKKKTFFFLGISVLVGLSLLYYYRYNIYVEYAGSTSSQQGMMVEDVYYDGSQEVSRDVSKKTSLNEVAVMPSVASPSEGYVGTGTLSQEERLIIKNGSMSLLVDDVEIAVGQIKQFAIEKGGFVVSSEIDTSYNEPSGSITIRIPSALFDANLGSVRALGEVQSERTDGRDVTEEYIDLEATLGNLKAAEEQFLSIMKQAVKIEDILAVQRELTNVRSNIDSLEGRMKYLKESADFSSLTVYLSTNPEQLPILDKGDTWKPLGTVKEALRGLQQFGIRVVDVFIWIIIYIPVWFGIGLVYMIVRHMYKKRNV